MKIITLLLMFVFFGTGCGQKDPAPQPSEMVKTQMEAPAKNYIQEGVAYLNKSDVASAIHSFNKAIIQNPQDPKPHLILAEVYMHLQKFDYAITNLDRAVVLDPNNGSAYFLRGICRGLGGDRKTAIKDVERSVAIFQQKKDEENFKKALLTLQQMMASENEAANKPVEKN